MGAGRHSLEVGPGPVSASFPPPPAPPLLPPITFPQDSVGQPGTNEWSKARAAMSQGGQQGLSGSGPSPLPRWVPERRGLQLGLLLFNQLVAI